MTSINMDSERRYFCTRDADILDGDSDDIFIEYPNTSKSWSTILLGFILSIFPLTTITIGSLYFNSEQYCPAGEDIALYLVIEATIWLLLCIIIIMKPILKNKYVTYIFIFLEMFSLVWLIILSLKIYKIEGTVQHTDQIIDRKNFCDEILYLYSFWITTSILVVVVASIITAGIVFIFTKCYSFRGAPDRS